MKKIVIAILVAILAVGGYFGYTKLIKGGKKEEERKVITKQRPQLNIIDLEKRPYITLVPREDGHEVAMTIADLKSRFDGLVVTDEINMLGLRESYHSQEQMYIDLFKAGNDIILNFDNDPNKLYYMIKVVEKAVRQGKINKEQIDNSVKKILEAKGFVVIE